MDNSILPIKRHDLLLGWQYTKIWGSEGLRLVHERDLLKHENKNFDPQILMQWKKISAIGFNEHAAVYLST